ncbi:OLC1v1000134C1 [Oldenlandia corymbosa var. corymbosa]|uniref:OLC1v1000134C1 n=1 Tax=Oldenlandia corymbosa var. corymbosa TaxID=529605 RepID=A0AAV1D2M0_OLDCO|nr:OLC1v1000134C1 [Oldenlandia corymbosa var. corymbosa]
MAIFSSLYLILLFLALYIITKHFLGKLRNLPPGPILNFPIIGHLYLMVKKPLFKSLARISSQYGPVILLNFGSRPVLLVSSPSAAEECLNKHDIVFANRPNLLPGKYLGYNYTSLASAPYGDHWRNLRRISALEILSSHRIQMLREIRVDEVKLMLRRLFLEASSTREKQTSRVEMRTVFFELTLNVMMRMIAGKRYYAGKNDEVDDEAAKRFREIVSETARVAGVSNLGDFLPILRWLNLDRLDSRLKGLQEKRDGFMQELIQEFKVNGNKINHEEGRGEKNKTLMEVLLGLQENDPEYYTDELIKSLILVLLSGATETSTGTMEWALSLMLNNPSTLKKAQEEIDNVVGKERLLDESDLVKLPYLRCIVNETLRLYPAGPLLPHQSSQECVVGGYRIPKGTMLLVNVWAIQNDPKFWDEPEKFKPERFEGIEGTKDGYKWMPFGSGRRSCAGENLALCMVGFGLGSIIQCFHWERIGHPLVDMTEGSGLTVPKVLLSGATETSTGTIEWALSLMLNNPSTKAQQEIDNLLGKERLLDESNVVKLPYLHCIVSETLRLYPAGPLLPHQSSQEFNVSWVVTESQKEGEAVPEKIWLCVWLFLVWAQSFNVLIWKVLGILRSQILSTDPLPPIAPAYSLAVQEEKLNRLSTPSAMAPPRFLQLPAVKSAFLARLLLPNPRVVSVDILLGRNFFNQKRRCWRQSLKEKRSLTIMEQPNLGPNHE